YSRPSVRGQGVAKAILQRLEAEAQDAGVPLLRIETGVYQQDALRFYERAGYRRCDAFGPYAELPAHAIETSIFYEKTVTPYARRPRSSAAARSSGSSLVTSSVSPVTGCGSCSRQACRNCRCRPKRSIVAGQYAGSPTTGWPIASRCTRIWCVRPVPSVTS